MEHGEIEHGDTSGSWLPAFILVQMTHGEFEHVDTTGSW